MRLFQGLLALAATAAVASVSFAGSPTAATGGGQSHTTIQPYTGLNYIVRNNGTSAEEYGEIALFAGENAPNGWLFANGQTLLTATNTNLFNQLGTLYGGDGIVTFDLPDLRGRAAVGSGQGIGTTFHSLGETFGAATETMTANQLPAHTHAYPVGQTSSSTGTGQLMSIMQPSLGVNYNIVAQGIFPSRVTTTSTPFVSQIKMHAGPNHTNDLFGANGQILQINSNLALYSLLGTTFGGNGQTTFGLPDLRGRVPIGTGSGAGLDFRNLGESFGSESAALTATQLPAHMHDLPQGGTTATTGANQPFANMQPSLGLNFMISTSGENPYDLLNITADSPFVGEVILTANTFAPPGWLYCDGSVQAIANYQSLFDIIGNTYGGDGTTTFALPDLQGRDVLGAGADIALGEMGGLEGVTLTVDQMASHTHLVEVPEPTCLGAIGLAALVGLRRRAKIC